MAILGLDGKFKELNPAFTKLVGYKEHEFTKAAWPSPHDRRDYKDQLEQLRQMGVGELREVDVQSTYMHGQGLMVPVVGQAVALHGRGRAAPAPPARGRGPTHRTRVPSGGGIARCRRSLTLSPSGNPPGAPGRHSAGFTVFGKRSDQPRTAEDRARAAADRAARRRAEAAARSRPRRSSTPSARRRRAPRAVRPRGGAAARGGRAAEDEFAPRDDAPVEAPRDDALVEAPRDHALEWETPRDDAPAATRAKRRLRATTCRRRARVDEAARPRR